VAERENELVGPIREFLSRSLSDERRVAMLESHGDDPKFLAEAAELGWFGLTAPETEGGLGLHPAELAQVFRVFGERLLTGPTLEQMLVPGLLLSSLIDRGQQADPIRERLRRVLAGEARVAVADPGVTRHWKQALGGLRAGSDRLSGNLELVRFGSEADEIVVVTADESGPLVVMVDRNRAGVTVTPRPSADLGATFATLGCDGVAISDADVIAHGPAAEALVTQLQAWQRVLVSCELAGIARRMLDLSVEYVLQREQFGRTIATFQVIRQMAATAAQRVILLENFCDAIAQDAPRLDAEELALAAMTLKANAAENARLVVEDALQMHGGIGFTYEYELHWYYKRALALRTWYGDERELAVEVGRRKLSA
jgi:alkylation response protein AidB-like acyl-CoA dehydrogenase